MFYLLTPFAIVGFAFTALLARGLLINSDQCSIATSRFIGTCVIEGHRSDEMVSAWAHRKHHKRTERLINWIFSDPNHCAKAYIAEMRGEQNADEYAAKV